MKSSFYISTPIYYVNDVPHIGHMYTTIAADTISRYKRLTCTPTFFLTGTDEHGQKISGAAKAKGLSPKELADGVVERYHTLWKKLDITNDDFIRTTEERHITTVQKIFSSLQEKGDIYLGDYEGWYCTPCEAFWTETQLSEDKLCPDCGRPTTRMKEASYFFKMSKYQEALLKHIETHPNFIRPESRKNEIVSFVKEGLRDLSVSRVTFSWGVPVKDDPRHVVYVWVDALVNYITALGYAENAPNYKLFWPASYHLVGKDILRFHAVYWPTLLLALGLPLPETVFAHGWWTAEGQKMSKTLGNAIDPFYLTDKFGVEEVRYFMLREVSFGLDGDFSYKALIHRINSDLANDFGNLANRTLGMVNRYFKGMVPASDGFDAQDDVLKEKIAALVVSYQGFLEELAFNRALSSVWEIIGLLNKYVDEMKPWALAKEESWKRLATVLYTASDGLFLLSKLLAPFMPRKAAKLRKQLGVSEEITPAKQEELFVQRVLTPAALGAVEPLFPRIDEQEMMASIQADNEEKEKAKAAEAAPASKECAEIAMEEFGKVLLVAVKVKGAERVPRSDKLLKLTVEDGQGERTIVAGIAASYTPEELVGKTLAVVGNLKPAKLMGVLSNGMVLAAYDGIRHHALILPDSVKAGTVIK